MTLEKALASEGLPRKDGECYLHAVLKKVSPIEASASNEETIVQANLISKSFRSNFENPPAAALSAALGIDVTADQVCCFICSVLR
jgi:hypothetical protein